MPAFGHSPFLHSAARPRYFFLKVYMGATILTGKHAAAFMRADGTVIYALFERTYEANCFPHEPRWHCQAIGTYEDAVHAITRAMNSCESQGLQAPNAMILPEKLLASWYKHLAKATTLPDIVIVVGGAGRSELSEAQRRCAVAVLLDMERADLAEKLIEGSLAVNLYADIEVVLRLFGVSGALRPWQALGYDDINSLPAPGLPLRFVPSKGALNSVADPKHDVLRIGQHHVLVREQGDKWKCWGYQYSAVQRFMAVHCRPLELAKPLSSVRAIEHFRELCRSAEPTAGDTVVEIQKPSPSAREGVVRCYHDVATRFGAVSDESVTVTVEAAGAAGMLTTICDMPQDYVTWRVVAPEPTAFAQLSNTVVQHQQLTLIV